MRALPALVAVAVLAVVGVACAGGDDSQQQIDELRAELDARAGAERALTDRIDELESEVVALRDRNADDPTEERLDAVDDELARLDDVITVLENDLAAEAEDRAAIGEELSTNISDLRSSLVDVQSAVDGLSGEVDELDALYASLRDRLDRLQRGG